MFICIQFRCIRLVLMLIHLKFHIYIYFFCCEIGLPRNPRRCYYRGPCGPKGGSNSKKTTFSRIIFFTHKKIKEIIWIIYDENTYNKNENNRILNLQKSIKFCHYLRNYMMFIYRNRLLMYTKYLHSEIHYYWWWRCLLNITICRL